MYTEHFTYLFQTKFLRVSIKVLVKTTKPDFIFVDAQQTITLMMMMMTMIMMAIRYVLRFSLYTHTTLSCAHASTRGVNSPAKSLKRGDFPHCGPFAGGLFRGFLMWKPAWWMVWGKSKKKQKMWRTCSSSSSMEMSTTKKKALTTWNGFQTPWGDLWEVEKKWRERSIV